MAFSSPPEIRTMRELKSVLTPLGYDVSQKVRLLDCVEAAAQDSVATTPVGPTMGDALIPAMREVAGPFGAEHAWLQTGDWSFAFKAHFDFVVHDKIDGENPTHPLFAVEFDGRSAHADQAARLRDRRKNRLCAASGLPLVRIGEEFLNDREQLSTIAWLAQLWAWHRDEMPRLLAERDASVDQLLIAERGDPWLLGERPGLDVDLVFGIRHPFPAVSRLARRLADEYGFHWPDVGAISDDVTTPWVIEWFSPPAFDLEESLVQTWTCEAMVGGPRGFAKCFTARARVRAGYPIYDDDRITGWDEFARGRLPYLPAGPWTSAPAILGEALCIHNLLVDIGNAIKRQNRSGGVMFDPGRRSASSTLID